MYQSSQSFHSYPFILTATIVVASVVLCCCCWWFRAYHYLVTWAIYLFKQFQSRHSVQNLIKQQLVTTAAGKEFVSVNVLENDSVRQGIKEYRSVSKPSFNCCHAAQSYNTRIYIAPLDHSTTCFLATGQQSRSCMSKENLSVVVTSWPSCTILVSSRNC